MFLFTVLTCLASLVEATNAQGTISRMRFLPPINEFIKSQEPKVSWFNQLINHFDNSTEMWRQRFYFNSKYYKQGGPVFLFIGGEFEMKPSFVGAGHIVEMAEQNNAFIFGLEHRYYGKSFPTKIIDIEASFAPLSAEQALADLARFVALAARRQDLSQLSGARWLAFGCSYPGMLAAWLRERHPQAVVAAVASSAPVQAQLLFPEYEEIVARVLRATKRDCLDNIEKACLNIRKLQKTNDTSLQRLFPDTNGDPIFVVNYLISALAQANYQILGRPIQTVCNFMTNAALGTPLERYSSLWKHFKDFNDASSLNGLEFISWRYQTCTEFGYQFTSDETRYPFRIKTLEESLVEECSIFGSRYDGQQVGASVDETNKRYGGRKPNVSRVVFTNGADDPWSPLGILSNPPKGDNHVIIIPGEPHCTDFLPSTSKDSPDLKKARKNIQALVKRWVMNAGKTNTTGEPSKCKVPGAENYLPFCRE